MDGNRNWSFLASGICVEDVRHNVLKTQQYEHSPSQYCVLDTDDDKWIGISTPEERQEICRLTPAIQYPPILADMTKFIIDIPETEDLDANYNYLENTPLDFKTEKHSLWLKHTIQNAIYLLEQKYLPITKNQQEEDICTHVWKFFMDAFNSSKLAAKQQKKLSSALRAAISKKRKIAIMNDPIQRQQHALIPDTTIYYGCSQAYAIIEAVKAHNNTKQLVEGFKKCPELMMHIFNQVFDSHPSEQRNIKIHGCPLSRITCTPLMLLSSPFGFVKLFSHGKQLMHPEA